MVIWLADSLLFVVRLASDRKLADGPSSIAQGRVLIVNTQIPCTSCSRGGKERSASGHLGRPSCQDVLRLLRGKGTMVTRRHSQRETVQDERTHAMTIWHVLD